MEKHINKIAIEILKEEYSDYPKNYWHYNSAYRMLVNAQNQVKKLNIANVSNQRELLITFGKKVLVDSFRSDKPMTVEDSFEEFKSNL